MIFSRRVFLIATNKIIGGLWATRQDNRLLGVRNMGRHHHYLRKLRFSIILPPIQFLLAVAMFEWARRVPVPRGVDTLYFPTATMVCYGINAPAIFLKLLAFPFTRGAKSWPLPSIFGYGPEELAFLVGVVILWFFVGKELDRQRLGEMASENRITPRRVLLDLLLMVFGIALFAEGLHGLHTPGKWGNYFGNIAESILFLVWSFVLIFLPGWKLIKRTRLKACGPDVSS